MKNLKKTTAIISLCALVLFSFTACHSHESSGLWDIDKENHYELCSCGEVLSSGAHDFDEDRCTVCGAQKTEEDGEIIEISVFNEYGEWTRCIYYGEDGEIESDLYAEYTYDEDGNKLSDKKYEGDFLISEGEYAFDSQGLSYLKYETEYYEDGSSCKYEYNEYAESLGYITYDENGKEVSSYYSEYITDEAGDVIGEKVYENEVLVQEIEYENVEGTDGDEDYAYTKSITYLSEDGSKYTEEYSEEGEIIREISYDTEGKIEYDLECKSVYDDEGTLTAVEKYEDGVLKQKTEYEYDEEGALIKEKDYLDGKIQKEIEYGYGDGYIYEAVNTEYYEDGTKSVSEYDENGELISEKLYDAEGNEM